MGWVPGAVRPMSIGEESRREIGGVGDHEGGTQEKEAEDVAEQVEMDESDEARAAKKVADPREPTAVERKAHEITHLPFRS